MVGRGAARRGRCAARGTARRGGDERNAVRLDAADYYLVVCVFLTARLARAPSRIRTHGVKEHGVRVEPRHDTEDLRSAQSVAARRFPQEGGEAREKARATEERGLWVVAGRAGERVGRVRGNGGGRERQGQNSLCYRLKFFTGKILIVAFY